MTSVPANQRDMNILAEQVRAQDSVSGTTVLTSLVGVAFLAMALWERVSHTHLFIWMGVACASQLARWLLSLAYRRVSPGIGESHAWASRFALAAGINGAIWGVAALVLFTPADLAGQAYLTMLLIGLAAGSITTSTPYLPANYAYVCAALIPLVVRTAAMGDNLHLVTALLLATYMGFVLFCSRNINHILIRSLRMRYENLDLIEALKAEKATAETARQQAESANQSKTRFLAAASHDLRQPLHALGLFVAALDARIRYPEVRGIVTNINKSINALEVLFNELLDVSKLDAGVITPSRTSFAIQPLFDRLAADCGPDALERGLRLRIVPSRLLLHSDPVLLERILRNLISNAIRYTLRGKILVGVRRGCATARVEVWDTGIGIAREQQERIFEEFYQLANPERDRGKGLGLGLAIVRRLTSLLDHRLALDSMVGKGSVFRIDVPVGRAVHLSDDPTPWSQPAEDALHGRHVAFIDDESAVREGMAILLLQWGCSATVAGSLDESLNLLTTKGRPDVIVADYRLRDGANGAQAIRHLQETYGADIPGVLLTGDTAPERIVEAKASGYWLLHKPVSPARLKHLLAYLVNARDRVP